MLFACTVSSNAQSLAFSAAGSSALFLELGEGAAEAPTNATCLWSYGSGAVQALDPSTAVDKGQVWIEWTPGTGTCTAPGSNSLVYVYLQTDSVVGDRCLFNGCVLQGSSAGDPTTLADAGLITESAGTQVTNVPASVWNVINGVAVNAAGTDIRPEDAEFAITRALTPCGQVVGTFNPLAVSTNQYLGLGYNTYTGSASNETIDSYYSSSTFNVVQFSLPSTFYVQPVGADPIIVFTNSTDPSGTGFNSGAIQNIQRTTLALFLDGSLGKTADATPPGYTGGTSTATTTIIREPLSGTYNTMEYNVPNTLVSQTSQDVGAEQLPAQQNCSGTSVASNPMNIENSTWGSYRNRAIGTGEEIKQAFLNNDTLAYAFWGVSNFASAPSTAKYLTVDGVDPIAQNYDLTNGVIPVTATQLTKVGFYHIKDGTYPIWSLLRLVTTNASVEPTLLALAQSASDFSTQAHPDFVPYYIKAGTKYVSNLHVERSHFTPPGIGFTKTPVNGRCGLDTEVGGDVGGVILNCQVDDDYATATGNDYIQHRN
jgi:hypothetical protein